MQYAKAREEERSEQKMCQLYVTDSLFYYSQGMRLSERYYDMLKKSQIKTPPKTGDEIVEDILTRHGIKFKKGGKIDV